MKFEARAGILLQCKIARASIWVHDEFKFGVFMALLAGRQPAGNMCETSAQGGYS
jgi:hypothetical protein